MRHESKHDRGRSRLPWLAGRRPVLALVLTALLAFVSVATISVFIARRIARDQALDGAVRTSRTIATSVFAPILPAVLRGDANSRKELDQAVRDIIADGYVVRVKVWSAQATLLYSDTPSQVGRTFPSAEVRDAISDGKVSAGVSDLKDAENVTEALTFGHLVEVYLPLRLDNGALVVFELYATDHQLRAAQSSLVRQLLPVTIGSLLLLVLLQLPVATFLVGRLAKARAERARLLVNSLAASDRERRIIARDLHDGVVQDLAGVGYALGAIERIAPTDSDAQVRRMLQNSSHAVQRSVNDLRNLAVDIRPPELDPDGLVAALRSLANRTRSSTLAVEVQIDDLDLLPPAVASAIYRCARECLVNVVKHAEATRAQVEVTASAGKVRLVVTDNGRGIIIERDLRRDDGHIGLALLSEAANDLGGALIVSSPMAGGTRVTLELPVLMTADR